MSSESLARVVARLKVILFAGALFWLGTGPGAIPISAGGQDAPLQKGMQPKGASGVYRDKVVPHWFADETKLWYRNNLKGGTKEFILVDVVKGTRGPAFDHAKLTAALSKVADGDYRADRLPFDDIEFADDAKTVQFDAAGKRWKCDLETYTCTEAGPAKKKSPEPQQPADDQPLDAESPWADGPASEQSIAFLQQPKKDLDRARSPDGKLTAVIKEFNIVLRDADGNETQLTKDGKEGLRLRPAPMVTGLEGVGRVPRRTGRTEGSPPDRIVSTRRRPCGAEFPPYDLPGDKFTTYELHVFDVENKKDLPVEDRNLAFATSYEPLRLRWNKDGHTFTYQRTDRGHQRFRLVEVDAHTGKSRNLIDEKTDTFIWTAHAEATRHAARDLAPEDATRSFTSPRRAAGGTST